MAKTARQQQKPATAADSPQSVDLNTIYDLGDDITESKFRINGIEFSCFPWDELEIIRRESEAAEKSTGQPTMGEKFWDICLARLATRGIKTSMHMAGRWYDALVKAHEDQLSFFDESPESSGSTASESSGDNSIDEKSGSSKSSASRSKRKSTRKNTET
jgi:hypothetical protein